ncbi:MAG: nitronate monooxygenase family protein [Gracilibacteraceae bacterium]|nr:nitronate monooxygenase family protein [Gracilibacteraceae bacterium]
MACSGGNPLNKITKTERGYELALQTRITEMLGIKYPIMCGGLQNIATPELAAAVSNAGGLGTINISMWPDLNDFRDAVKKTKSLTDKPMCVNISMIPGVDMGDKIQRYINICGEEKVEVLETSGKDPAELVPLIRSLGIRHIHKVPAVKHGVRAEKSGAEIISIVGAECGGHPGADMIGTFILGAEAYGKYKAPYQLGGGVYNGRTLAAAMALGAEGVVVGTLFCASKEAPISDNHKQWIIGAADKDTVLCQKSIKNVVRVANNQTARDCLEMEKKPGVTLQDLMPIIGGNIGKEAYKSGDISKGMFPVGQVVGSITEIKSVKDIIDGMVTEAVEVLGQLDALRRN